MRTVSKNGRRNRCEKPHFSKHEKWGNLVFSSANTKSNVRYTCPPEMRVTRRDGTASSYDPKSLRRMVPAMPSKPVPNNPSVPGSGTARLLRLSWMPPWLSRSH
jgi:hypothetical protein